MTLPVLPPVLLPSAVIVADHSVALKDEADRVRHTLESVEKWQSLVPGIRLVICDGSSFDFTPLVQERFPDARIECLAFRNDAERVRQQGKGYGEGEIINFALAHSATLAGSDVFAKCTAKLWVENFRECLQGWNGKLLCAGYFADVFSLNETRFGYVDTRFYVADKAYYRAHFASAHTLTGPETGLSIEDCFRNIILEDDMNHVLFNVAPVICGVGGGSGTYYRNNLKRRLKERLRLRLVKADSRFRQLFA